MPRQELTALAAVVVGARAVAHAWAAYEDTTMPESGASRGEQRAAWHQLVIMLCDLYDQLAEAGELPEREVDWS